MSSSDSFHNEAADECAFYTGFTRLFSMAVIESEYALATIADAQRRPARQETCPSGMQPSIYLNAQIGKASVIVSLQ